MARDFSSGFFQYPTPDLQERSGDLSFLGHRPDSDWQILLEHSETRRFSPGDAVIRAGEEDRALYLLTEGKLGAHALDGGRLLKTIEAPSVVGEVSFLDGGTRSLTLMAMSPGELERLSMQAFEVLSARYPDLGRAILLDLGRIVARRLRMATELVDRGAE